MCTSPVLIVVAQPRHPPTSSSDIRGPSPASPHPVTCIHPKFDCVPFWDDVLCMPSSSCVVNIPLLQVNLYLGIKNTLWWFITFQLIWTHRNTPGDQSSGFSCCLRVRPATQELVSSLEGLLTAAGSQKGLFPASPTSLLRVLYNFSFWWEPHICWALWIRIVLDGEFLSIHLREFLSTHYHPSEALGMTIVPIVRLRELGHRGLSHCLKVRCVSEDRDSNEAACWAGISAPWALQLPWE